MLSTRTGRLRSGAVLATAVAGAVLAQTAALAAPAPTPPAPGPAPVPAPAPPPDRYLDQRISWEPCLPTPLPPGFPAGSERLECGTYAVPRDWHAPRAGQDLTIAVSRLRPASGRAPRSILTNPGGPGGPGLTLPLVYLQAGRTAITETREIVGIDPRGTGASTNVTCGGATTTGSTLDVRDRSKRNTDLVLDAARFIARACQYEGRDLSRFITTEQTVKDLDLLRALLGRDTIDWIGYSGGTWMGAAYATYFPDRVGRFVLDGNVEFTAPFQKTFGRQPFGFGRRFSVDFLPWAARYDRRFGLGATPAQVRGTYEQLRARLAADPVDLAGLLEIDEALLDSLVLQAMYSKAAFSQLADDIGLIRTLADGGALPAIDARVVALRGSVEKARTGADMRLPAEPLALDAQTATFFTITCNDTPTTATRESLLRFSAEQGERHALYGYYTLLDPCAFWDRSRVPTLAPRTGKGVPPVLMVQNERDPATTYEGALAAKRDWQGAKMITVVDEGDHTIYPGNPCVDAKVEAFLLGRAPAADATCRTTGLPAPDPVAPTAPAGTPVERAEALQAAQTR